MSDIRFLVVDADSNIRRIIRENIEREGYLCDEASDGIIALKLFRRKEYALVILDFFLPVLSGTMACGQIRKASDIPIIMISSSKEEADILACFEQGVDDYLIKPFYLAELLARIRVFLRRSGVKNVLQPKKISFQGLYIDTVSHSVYVNENLVQLTPKEYQLLLFLSQNPNTSFSRNELLNEVWGYDFFGSDRTVDTHVKTLRENIKPYQRYIATVWGFGYKFEATE